jgi:methionyl-tRNA formyltransferase
MSIVGVVTAPQTLAISYRPNGVTNVLHADVAALAQNYGIPVRTMIRIMNEPGLLEVLSGWKPDAFLVAGWYHMVPRQWRELAPDYGLHDSLLPDYSGGAPLVWAIIKGESKIEITLFQMDGGVNFGPIAGQKEEPIYPNDTIATLYARIEERGHELLRDTLPQLAGGTLTLHMQDETKRHIVPQHSPEDGMIQWTQDAGSIDRFIRAQTRPYPGAFLTLKKKAVHIWAVKVVEAEKNQQKTGCVERKKKAHIP